MSLQSSAARGSAITLASQLVRLVVMLASTVILARLLSPNDYGLIAMVTAIVGIADIFRDFGLSMAALQAKDLSQYQKSNLFWINAVVGFALMVIIFALAYPIAAFYGEPRLVPMVQIISTVYLVGGLSAQFRVAINRQLRFFALSMSDIVPLVLAFVGAYVLAVGGAGVWALVVQQMVIAIGSFVMVLVLARWWPSLPRRGQNMKPLLTFGLSFAATQLISYATRNIDTIAIGRVWGPTPLGFYNRAYQLMVLPLNQINTPLSRVAVPVLSRITEDRDRYLNYLRKAQLVACYLTASLFLVVAAIGPEAVQLLLGDGWDLAGQILSILAIGGLFRSIQQISYWMYMSQGMAGQQLRFYLVAQPVVIAAMLAGLPWGPIGVAVGNAAGYAFFWAASLLWAGRVSKLDVRPLITDAVRAIVLFGLPGAVVAFCVVTFTDFDNFAKVALAVLGALVWYALAWLLIPSVKRDLKVLFDFGRLAIARRKKD